eukprot:5869961-Pyramimonas_sp.AAC.1
MLVHREVGLLGSSKDQRFAHIGDNVVVERQPPLYGGFDRQWGRLAARSDGREVVDSSPRRGLCHMAPIEAGRRRPTRGVVSSWSAGTSARRRQRVRNTTLV